MKKKILRTASFALATALSLSVCVSAFVSDGTNNNVTTSVLPDSADNAKVYHDPDKADDGDPFIIAFEENGQTTLYYMNLLNE